MITQRPIDKPNNNRCAQQYVYILLLVVVSRNLHRLRLFENIYLITVDDELMFFPAPIYIPRYQHNNRIQKVPF